MVYPQLEAIGDPRQGPLLHLVSEELVPGCQVKVGLDGYPQALRVGEARGVHSDGQIKVLPRGVLGLDRFSHCMASKKVGNIDMASVKGDLSCRVVDLALLTETAGVGRGSKDDVIRILVI